jgi:ribonuclease H2 subunit A
MDPIFGWGNVCRFSWATAKDLLEAKGDAVKVEWPAQEDEESMLMTDFLGGGQDKDTHEMADWFGTRVGEDVF